ncbi:hypothetical protein BH11ACT3_BH11ACT3_17170 [soil metagenome]
MILTRAAAPLLIVLALAGCATATPDAATTPDTSSTSDTCDVRVLVDFGTLGADPIDDCASAGIAADSLTAAGVTTEGTADYGDQVICRVNEEPAPADETCATLPADFYWALWVKSSADAEWEYAQEGAATLQLDTGQSLALVYTDAADADPAPPQD